MRNLTLALLALSLPACATTPTSGVYAVQAPAAAAACGSCEAASAEPVAGPLMVPAGAPTLGMQYGIGPKEYAKAGFMIPAEAVVCVGNFARCLTNVFFPEPKPTAHYVSVQPVQYVQPAAAPAKACAPAPVPQFAPAPAPRKACPEPVAACTGPECQVAGK